MLYRPLPAQKAGLLHNASSPLVSLRLLQSPVLRAQAATGCRSRVGWRMKEGGFRLRAEPDLDESPMPEYKSEEQIKAEKAEELRQAEKFLVIGAGNATCSSCGYRYEAENGDPDFPIAPGTQFEDTPENYCCPLCGAPKEKFRSTAKTIAGFAVNQSYGFGTNTWTGGQKQLLIFGSLLFFFALFIAGYFLE